MWECEKCDWTWYSEDYGRETCNYSGPAAYAPCDQEVPNNNLEGGAYTGEDDEYYDTSCPVDDERNDNMWSVFDD